MQNFNLEHSTNDVGAHRYSFFNLGARWRWMINATPRPLNPGKEGCVGPRAECGKIRPHWDWIPGPSSPKRVTIPAELARPTAVVGFYADVGVIVLDFTKREIIYAYTACPCVSEILTRSPYWHKTYGMDRCISWLKAKKCNRNCRARVDTFTAVKIHVLLQTSCSLVGCKQRFTERYTTMFYQSIFPVL
jgi:hypothetical protein